MKKKILIICIFVLVVVVFLFISAMNSNKTVEDFINAKYNNVSYENFTVKYDEQNEFISDNRVSIINPMNEEGLSRFSSDKTHVNLESYTTKIIGISNMSNIIIVNSIYKVVFTSEIDEDFMQTTHYNVDYYLKRKGLFKFEIFDIIENSAVRVLASEEEHTHEHEHTDTN